jgi:hypothetical protein
MVLNPMKTHAKGCCIFLKWWGGGEDINFTKILKVFMISPKWDSEIQLKTATCAEHRSLG